MQGLDRTVERYLRSGLAASTQKVYGSAQKRYKLFCSASKLPPLPTSEQTLCRFVAHLADAKLSQGTIKGYLAGVRNLHITQGYGDPHISAMSRLELVLRGIKPKAKAHPGRHASR